MANLWVTRLIGLVIIQAKRFGTSMLEADW